MPVVRMVRTTALTLLVLVLAGAVAFVTFWSGQPIVTLPHGGAAIVCFLWLWLVLWHRQGSGGQASHAQ